MTQIDNALGKTIEAFKVILRSLKNLNPTKVQRNPSKNLNLNPTKR